jgi:hypothetical protein
MSTLYQIYAIVDKRVLNEYLYIGKTKTRLGQRLSGHLSQARSNKPSLLSLYINDAHEKYIDIVCLDICRSQEEMDEKEKEYIRHYQPNFNVEQYVKKHDVIISRTYADRVAWRRDL